MLRPILRDCGKTSNSHATIHRAGAATDGMKKKKKHNTRGTSREIETRGLGHSITPSIKREIENLKMVLLLRATCTHMLKIKTSLINYLFVLERTIRAIIIKILCGCLFF